MDFLDKIKLGFELSPEGHYLVAPVDYYNNTIEQNVAELEVQHKLLFATLALSNNTYCNMYKKFYPAFIKLKKKGIDYTKSQQFKDIIALGQTIVSKAKDWADTQTYLEQKAKIPKVPVTSDMWLNPAKSLYILFLAQHFFKKGVSGEDISGAIMGIGNPVVAIVWGAALITAGIAASYIIKRMTVSTQDRLDLLNATKQSCVDLKLTPEECTQVMNTAQTEETKNAKSVTDTVGVVGSTIKTVGILALLAGALIVFSKRKKQAA